MTSVVDRTHGGAAAPPGTAASRDGWLSRWGATLAVAVVVLLRLPYLWAPMTSDEGGFLAVAAQWRRGGGSLYGSYWVDRPPLLITVYQLASQLGGLTALRLICGNRAVMTDTAMTAYGSENSTNAYVYGDRPEPPGPCATPAAVARLTMTA